MDIYACVLCWPSCFVLAARPIHMLLCIAESVRLMGWTIRVRLEEGASVALSSVDVQGLHLLGIK